MPLTLKETLARLKGELNVLQQDGWLSFDALLARLEIPNDNDWRRFIMSHIPEQHKDWKRFSSSVQRAYQVRLSTEKAVVTLEARPFIATALKKRIYFFAPEIEPMVLLQSAPPLKPEQRSFSVTRVAPYGWSIEEFPGGIQEPQPVKEEQQVLRMIRAMRRERYPDYTIVTVLNKNQRPYRSVARWSESDIEAVLTFDENFRDKFKLPPPDDGEQKKKKRSS
jgi:hypothetical protein